MQCARVDSRSHQDKNAKRTRGGARRGRPSVPDQYLKHITISKKLKILSRALQSPCNGSKGGGIWTKAGKLLRNTKGTGKLKRIAGHVFVFVTLHTRVGLAVGPRKHAVAIEKVADTSIVEDAIEKCRRALAFIAGVIITVDARAFLATRESARAALVGGMA
jgi:hypothetical protein